MKATLKRFFKIFFSRVLVVGLAVILQVALVVYFAIKLEANFAYLQIISAILGLLVFIAIVNTKSNPEHKFVWMCLIILVPIVGVTLYTMFFLNTPSKKKIAQYTKIEPELLTQDEDYKKEVYNIADKYTGQIKYIENMSSLNSYKNTNCTYLKDGKEFYDSLIKDLKNAKKFIFMEYFIINHGTMWNSILEILKEKVKEGVEVRFLYDDVGCAQYLKGSYYKKLRSYGIQCYKYNKLIPIVSSYHNNRDHRKITVIDGFIGYTGGINLSDEYMNITHPFGYWKDNAVRIYGEAVDNLTVLFLQNYGFAALKKQEFEKYLYKNNEHPEIISDEIVVPYGTGPSSRYYDNMATDVFLNMISQARVSIDISTPYLIIDNALTNALIAAVARGVKVRILIPSIPDKKLIYQFAKSTAYELIQYGVEIYTFTPGFNHAKSFLVDDEIAFVGTTNLDFRSLIHHHECGAWIYNSPCIKDIDANFEADYLNSKFIEDPKELKSNFIVRLFISVLRIFESLL